ncbi:MAG: hypothetical protein QOE75_2932 [Solirubrobacterales bacterium]|jgi:hypothetical protein|nr:hypothetical protein [Solirubrobacterales bacterium]
MAASPGFRIGATALLAALAAVLGVVLLTSSWSDAADRYKPPRVDQSQMLLRLPDLPPGYGNGYLGEGRGGDGLLCTEFSEPEAQHGPLVEFVRRYRPRGCIAAYGSRFTIPEQEEVAPAVFSGVTALGSAAAAKDAWRLIPAMLGRVLTGVPPKKVATDLRVGSRTQLFHTGRAWYPYALRGLHKASFLAWRSGSTVAVVVAMGGSVATNDRAVAELAPRQQEHILGPTPYTKAERSDAEVGLDDPAIDLPVYWLGRVFEPGGGLPSTELYESGYRGKPIPEETSGGFAEGPYAPLQANYGSIRLATWTPQTWRVFAGSKTGRAITSWKCTQTRTVPIPGGSAKIFGGYKKNYARCPKKVPQAFTAWVDVAGVKITVNAPPAPDFIETVNPYGSFAGMEAIVSALVERPKPVY